MGLEASQYKKKIKSNVKENNGIITKSDSLVFKLLGAKKLVACYMKMCITTLKCLYFCNAMFKAQSRNQRQVRSGRSVRKCSIDLLKVRAWFLSSDTLWATGRKFHEDVLFEQTKKIGKFSGDYWKIFKDDGLFQHNSNTVDRCTIVHENSKDSHLDTFSLLITWISVLLKPDILHSPGISRKSSLNCPRQRWADLLDTFSGDTLLCWMSGNQMKERDVAFG